MTLHGSCINHLIFTYGSKQIIIFLKIGTILLSVACVYLFSTYCFKYLYLFSLIILGGVCVCVCWPCGRWTKKRKIALSALSTWFCPLSSDLSGFCLTDFSKNCLIGVWRSTVLHFLPGSSCLDFWTLLWNTSCQRCVRDFSWIYFCWLVEITQCLYAATFLTPCCPADCSTTRRWNVMHSAVGVFF